jgi:pentatricopeptide repeat protein
VEGTEAPLARCFAKVVLEACTALKDVDLAAEVFEKASEADAAALRTVVERAATGRTTRGAESGSLKEAHGHAVSLSREIKACAKNGDLDGACNLFEELCKTNACALAYNSIMDACIECGKYGKAMEYFNTARSSGLVDTVSYNIAMKVHLAQGQLGIAKTLFAELSKGKLTPTLASYHGFLNFYVTSGMRECTWQIVSEMQAASVMPTAVTCSILLKGKLDAPEDMQKVLDVVDTIQPLDEVLFHSLAEACIRTRQLHLLSQYQARLESQGSSPTLSAPTYGSMIKAFGQAWDVSRVWALWTDMAKHKVEPTAITLGCMVEALVTNRCTADAWKLVQDLQSDESTKQLVNTVIYSTILKGFAYCKETDKVTALYEEMKANDIQPNNITFNTILNAFAQGGAMDRVPALLEDMKNATPPAEPDIVTFSTIIKGYCNSGCLDKGLAMLKEMQTDGKFMPDEVLYNSLLDGCAKEHRPNDALNLLEDMRRNSVAPSNYTLSMFVKLMGRCRRLNQAFTIIEDISREYGLKVNIQVYTCLIQACFNNRQAGKAVALHDQIIKEGLTPDEMTYSALVKGCLQAGRVDQATHLARCAHGLAEPKCKGMPPGLNSRCIDELASALGAHEGNALRTELARCQVAGPKGKGGSKGQGKGAKGGSSNPPWRHQK